jgi:hypothetical protein
LRETLFMTDAEAFMTDAEATMASISRSSEAEAALTAIHWADPDPVRACDGWATHEIAAHVTSIARRRI